MTFPEMIYEVVVLLFSNIWKYLGLLIIIFAIKGDIEKAIKSINTFRKQVAERYREKLNNLTQLDRKKKNVRE